jgi:tyrosine-protein phosphatase SIW14
MMMQYAQELCPPDNFALVYSGVYRSGFPTRKNFEFLKKLKLKSIMFRNTQRLLTLCSYLCLEDYSDAGEAFIKENDIRLFKCGVTGNKVVSF